MMKNLQILVIDDDIVTLAYFNKVVSNTPFSKEVSTLTNGKEALDHLDQQVKEMEQVLIFLDINMPVLDGWGFLEELQNRDYKDKVNVLIISSSNALSDKKKSNQYPQVIGYLVKPLEAETLLDVMDLFRSNIILPNPKTMAFT